MTNTTIFIDTFPQRSISACFYSIRSKVIIIITVPSDAMVLQVVPLHGGCGQGGVQGGVHQGVSPLLGGLHHQPAEHGLVRSYSWYHDPPGRQGEYLHPPDVNVELGVDHAGVEADAGEAVPALVHQPPQLPREHHLANHSSVFCNTGCLPAICKSETEK